MPVENHPLISPPNDPLERIWRYMDLAKFISLISRQELYLCNLEVLAANDPYEGLLSKPNYRHREWHSIDDLTPEERKVIFYKEGMTDEEQRTQLESQRNAKEYWLRRRFYDRRTMLINCWHLNRYESAAMWPLYSLGGQGIAITTNHSRMTKALANTERRLFLGLVKYLDFSTDPVDNSFVLPFSKRASFAYENEVRLVYWDLNVQEKLNSLCEKLSSHTMDHLYRRVLGPINWNLIEDDIQKVSYTRGIYVPVDSNSLIDQVYVSPSSPDWFLEIVSVLCKKFSLPTEPIRSDLSSSPVR